MSRPRPGGDGGAPAEGDAPPRTGRRVLARWTSGAIGVVQSAMLECLLFLLRRQRMLQAADPRGARDWR